ncbi:autotransporter-associated beta strand repeat-containing protein [Lactiplantibacillus plantarum]|uniref:autotransporter-associated beta strand repeat-containing protein n=1 Tax=Lactiplantibacillus plantarum TaxID=1590 RepID=UPI00404643A6
MTFTTVLFYILAAVLVIAAFRVITARSPVTAVLHLILAFAGDIYNYGMLVFDRSDDVQYASVVSGDGSVTKDGGGRLLLTGGNTYSGGTLINAGVLQLGDGGTVGAIAGNVVNNATLIFDRGDAVTARRPASRPPRTISIRRIRTRARRRSWRARNCWRAASGCRWCACRRSMTPRSRGW